MIHVFQKIAKNIAVIYHLFINLKTNKPLQFDRKYRSIHVTRFVNHDNLMDQLSTWHASLDLKKDIRGAYDKYPYFFQMGI